MAEAWLGYGRLHGGPDQALSEAALRYARDLDDPVLTSSALDALAAVATALGRHTEALALTEDRLELLARLPRHDPGSGIEVADIFHVASEAAIAAGELDVAIANARLAADDRLMRQGLEHFAAAHIVVPLVLQGAFDDAMAQAAVMRHGWERAGRPPAGWMSPSFFAAAMVCALRSDEAAYRDWWAVSDEVSQRTNSPAFRRFTSARISLHRGAVADAVAVMAQPRRVLRGRLDPYDWALGAEVAVAAGLPDAERYVAEAEPFGAENALARAFVARAAGRLSGTAADLERAVGLWESVGARFEWACTLCLLGGRRAMEGRRVLATLGCAPPVV
jgi:hypothetical protein